MKIPSNRPSSPGQPWRLIALGIFILLISSPLTFAQQKLIRFQHIDPADSFATRAILAVTQDEQGFLWFASLYGGVARYDGYEFKIYQHDPGNPNSLPTNEIHSLYADQNGLLWIGTAEGLVLLDTRSDRITVFRHEEGNPQTLSDSGVAPILRDSHGILWVGTEDGLNRQEPGSDQFTYYPLRFENSDPNVVTPAQWVWSLFEDSAGNLWAGTLGGGLLVYNRSSDSFTRFLNDPENPESLPYNVVRDITEDRSGNLWVATSNGLARLVDRESARFEVLRPRDIFPEAKLTSAWKIVFDQQNNLWASLGQAVMLRPAGSDQFELIQHDPMDPGSLGDGRVWTLLEDQSGMLWAPSDTISWMVPTQLAFSIYPRALPPTDEDFLTSTTTTDCGPAAQLA